MTTWGLIGLGKIAGVRLAPAFAQSSTEQLVAAAGRDAERTRAFAERHGLAPRSIDDLLADPAITAVYIAATNDLHAPYTRAAAAAGKHVLCEKPLARTVDEAEAMIAACRAAGVLLGTAFMMRYHPLHQAVRELIATGTLGRLLQARVQYGFELRPGRQTWRIDEAISGGGPIMDVGSHAIDLLTLVTGRALQEVSAFTARQTLAGSTEDAAVLNLRFDGDLLGQVNVAFNLAFAPTLLEVHGTAGSIVARGTIGQVAEGQAEVITADGTRALPYTPRDLYQAEIEAFGRAVRGEAPLEQTAEAGLRNLLALRAAYDSAATEGRAVATGGVPATGG